MASNVAPILGMMITYPWWFSQVERLDMCDYQIVLTSIPLIIPYYALILPLIWVNYNNLTATLVKYHNLPRLMDY
jgi:hypothetical protein